MLLRVFKKDGGRNRRSRCICVALHDFLIMLLSVFFLGWKKHG